MEETARDVMTADPECLLESDNLLTAARKMRDLDVGVLPICSDSGDLKGILTDRDIVVRCLAEGADPGTTLAGSMTEGKPVTVSVADALEDVMETMAEFQVRRVPVVDGDRLVGIISEADIARYAAPEDVAVTVQSVTN